MLINLLAALVTTLCLLFGEIRTLINLTYTLCLYGVLIKMGLQQIQDS